MDNSVYVNEKIIEKYENTEKYIRYEKLYEAIENDLWQFEKFKYTDEELEILTHLYYHKNYEKVNVVENNRRLLKMKILRKQQLLNGNKEDMLLGQIDIEEMIEMWGSILALCMNGVIAIEVSFMISMHHLLTFLINAREETKLDLDDFNKKGGKYGVFNK